MARLVIVESPAKARTINKFLGDGYEVKATLGHVRDLPKKELGVNIENDFAPEYVTIRGRGKTLRELKESARRAEEVLIATDKDREGEAIGWHVKEAIEDEGKKVRRILFDEITREAIQNAVNNPLEIDQNKVDAQQARRILDRLVGYKISPILWRKVGGGLSAGRVQSVALRLVCEREKEIRGFVPREYWSIEALFTIDSETFEASLWKVNGDKAEIPDQAAAESIVADLQQAAYRVSSVSRKQVTRRPFPPFITSTLQQQASVRLGFSARKTMVIAQQLYEGIELGAEDSVGLISYMRTDSTRISAEAQRDALQYIRQTHGAEYCPARPNVYKNKKSAQDAHEAVRPTSVFRSPDSVEASLSPDQMKLYTLIWTRFVASQMAAARLDQMAVEVEAGRYLFRATGSVVRFPGFRVVYVEDENGNEEKRLPDVSEGQVLSLENLTPNQHFTKPPPRYSEASLVKTLEEKGIGRPSTYAAIVNTIQARKYVRRSRRRFYPTELGEVVNELLVSTFPDIIDTEFTAALESKLDEVEEGKADWKKLLTDFYYPFQGTLEAAVKDIPTSEVCDRCGKGMVIKWGRFGRFLACSGYPECKNTKEFVETESGDLQVVEAKITDHKCEKCSGPMIVKRGRYGEFLACQNYPECEFTRPLEEPSDADGGGAGQEPIAPEEKCDKCGKDIVVKNGRYGKFLACSGYPACKNTKPLNGARGSDRPGRKARPTDEKCQKCSGKMIVRQGRYGEFLACENYPDCKFTMPLKLDVLCPRESCGGELVEKRTKKRKIFYGCSKYPTCDFALWDRPVNEECPECGARFLVVKRLRTGGEELRCAQEGCDYQADLADASVDADTS